MRHLSEAELVDVAEGTDLQGASAHLAACDDCRGQVATLRAMMSAARDVTVPEPSPLFWEHLSARVREQVASLDDRPASFDSRRWDPASAPREWDPPSAGLSSRRSWAPARLFGILPRPSWRFALPAAALAAVVAAAIATLMPDRQSPATAVAPMLADVNANSFDPMADDPSLSLIADLAGDLDWDDAVEAGLPTDAAALDHALFDLTADERLELQQILEQELSGLSGRGV
jgi:hypothetical protein